MKSYPQRTPQQLADQIELAVKEFNNTYPDIGRIDKRPFTEDKDKLVKGLAKKYNVPYKNLFNIVIYQKSTNTKRGEGYLTQERRITAKQA